jgi:GNAT superfamily N-acetyltransferase
MAATEPIAIVELGPSDALAGLALSTEAHWNQNEADWRFFLTQGTVFGVRDDVGLLIATGALLPYTSGNAWIGMVLVTASQRRRGLATRLVDACLHAAKQQNLTSWLDATPDGAKVYGRLGFEPTLQLQRLRLDRPASPQTATAPPSPASSLDDLIENDRRTMGFDRRALLLELGQRPGSRLVANSDAMALVRDGRKIRHIGPLFAGGPAAAHTIVEEIVEAETGPLLLDAVSTTDGAHDRFLKGLLGRGWTVERPFQRMRFGRAIALPAELPFAVTGPEFG